MIHSFIIPGKKVGHPGDVRIVRAGTKVRAYRSRPSRDFMAHVLSCAHLSGLRGPIDGPIAIDLEVRRKLPKRTCFSVGEPHTQRPDWSNHLKMIEDALKPFFDDAQVCAHTGRKVWHDKDEIEVTLTFGEDFLDKWGA